MDIIFHGQHQVEEAIEVLSSVLHLFKERYQIAQFREMVLMLTLIDRQGEEVELVDSHTAQIYRIFEVYKKGHEIEQRPHKPILQLVVDNTHNKL